MSERVRSLDKGSPVPLYYQLFLRIQNDVQTGIARPGDLLGTEKDLQVRYGVSRATVRKALDELHRLGLVKRITGRGTFVTEPTLAVHAPHLLSLTEELSRRGIAPGSQVLAFDFVNAGADVARALGIRRNDEVRHIRRVRTGDGDPIVLVDHFVHPTIRLEREDLGQSLYATLQAVVGARLQEAFHTVRADGATEDEAELLRICTGEPVLRFERTTLAANGRPVVYELGTGRSDRYEYSVHLFR